MNDERRKIKFLTEVTGDFHGLKMIAFGFLQIIIASLNYLADLDSQKRDFAGKDITFPVIFLLLCIFVGLALKPSVRNYLADKFGRAVQKPPTIEKRLQIWMCVIPLIFGFLVSVWVDATYSLSFSLTVLTVAATTFIFWLETYRGISNTSLYLSMIFLIFSFLPWESISALLKSTNAYSAKAAFFQNLLSLFLGISYLTIGLDDIRLVFSMMKPIEKEQDYESF
jgi:hypothetical protein